MRARRPQSNVPPIVRRTPLRRTPWVERTAAYRWLAWLHAKRRSFPARWS